VRLENLLRDIQSDRANLRHGRLPQVVLSTPPLWHTDAVEGASTPSEPQRERSRQLPAGQRCGLIQRADLALEQRQVMQRVEDEVFPLVRAEVPGIR
jgi:hypothetical protein